ncbi:hypothetical protein KBX37_28520 [Micromonospora sp. U56]|uniref:hypothetical protein n=1 Tax=Micromonospora sp. U56 TaxID=2824900 RepID=UPI001B362802|nr:hypothetical protein [Micromonospora sp. U56]MBQ0896987.1 hypothetical protein [Micromonospora sp. U56]
MISEAALDEVLRSAARVRVTDGGVSGVRVLGEDVLLEVAEPAAVRQLIRALAVEQTTDGYCMCHGDLAFEFFDRSGRLTAAVGFHHANYLRWSGWDGDAMLRDGGAVLRWLAEQGVEGPLVQEEQRQWERHEQRLAEQRWRAAAPASVRDLLDVAVDAGSTDGLLPEGIHRLVAQRVEEAIPDPVERAGVMLAWYGSGTGRCSGFPVHEGLPEPALAETPIAHLVRALQAYPTDARIDAGAVRHLCGWKTRKHQARDIAKVPAELRVRLLTAARESGDDDKRRRAERWLSAPSGHRPR